jgi:two-component system sensor histidine kinase KdpD
MEQRRRSDAHRADHTDGGGVLPPPLGSAGLVRGDDAAHATRRAAGHADARAVDLSEPMRVVEILSHELRSPITTIHLGTKVLRQQGLSIARPVRQEVVEAVEEEAERLYRLVEDLLAVARHEGGAAPLTVGPLSLQHWLPPVIAAEVHAYPTLLVRASVQPDLAPVLADDGALQHVVRNLLANAVRYAAGGMPVELVARPLDDATIAIEILDRGPGIAPEESTQVFEPFYRSRAADAFGSGAGLGLAAAHRLMRAMDGGIEVLPRDGGGARFVLTLPAARPDEDDGAADGWD